MGTAGAVLAGFDLLAHEFVVMYGDTMVNVDLERMRHARETSDADAALLLHPNDHPLDSDLVEADAENWITAFHNRPHPAVKWFPQPRQRRPLCHQQSCTASRGSQPRQPMDFGKDLFPAMVTRGAKLLAYNSPEYIKDIGTPERYDRICAEYANGVVQRGSLHTAQRAVFLDRDGTLVKEVNGLTTAGPVGTSATSGNRRSANSITTAGWRCW